VLKTLETDRLILRERTIQDMESCLEMDRDPEVVKFIPEIAELLSDEDEHRKFIKERMDNEYPSGMGYWVIEVKGETNVFVGWIMLIPIDAIGPEIEMGWRLKRKYWGEGFATEAAQTILNYALHDIKVEEVVADIHCFNKGSERVAEKIGLQCEGRLGSKVDKFSRFSITNK